MNFNKKISLFWSHHPKILPMQRIQTYELKEDSQDLFIFVFCYSNLFSKYL